MRDDSEWMGEGWEEPVPPAAGPLGCLLGGMLPLALVVLLVLIHTVARSVRFPVSAAAPAQADLSQKAKEPVGAGALAPFFTPEVQYWTPKILRWAQDYGLDPNLVATVMQIESCGDPQATSVAGARGLFQVMPYHFAPGEDPYQPQVNARRGLGYLRRMLRRAQGDVGLALAMYNGGPGVQTLPPAYWPAETQRYVTWGAGIYADARAGRERSPTLERWLAAGGRSLCWRAHQRLGLP